MRKMIAVLFLALAVALFGGTASADVNDFTIKDFQADYALNNNDPQGELHITERIQVAFTDHNHGILRAIPKTYKNKPLHVHVLGVTSDTGAPTEYKTSNQNGNLVLRIGDPSRTVFGEQEYTIRYRLSNVATFYPDHDELYWDINGDQWQQPFEHVSVTVHLPHGLLFRQVPVCYAGPYSGTQQPCTAVSTDKTITASTTQPLGARETLTIVAGFQKGFFRSSNLLDMLGDYWQALVSFAVLPVLVGGFGLRAWLRRGRDAKGRGTIVPQYDAPDNLTPLEVGTVIDFKLDNRDLTATIIDLALRKYLKIIESKTERRLRKDALSYTLELVNTDFSGLRSFEKSLLEALFPSQEKNAQINITASKAKLYKEAQSLRKSISHDMTTHGYFKADPLTTGRALTAITAVLLIGTFALGGLVHLALFLGGLLALLLGFLFVRILPARTEQGVLAKEHIEGLRLYLQTAEADRIKMLQSPDAAYAQNHKEPKKTVQLFEKLLPYAIVLGVETAWAKQFEHLYTTPPDWYVGDWTTFNAVILTQNLNTGMLASMNNTFSAPQSSSSSGFGGGGFSGGGGGGGGGGGW